MERRAAQCHVKPRCAVPCGAVRLYGLGSTCAALLGSCRTDTVRIRQPVMSNAQPPGRTWRPRLPYRIFTCNDAKHGLWYSRYAASLLGGVCDRLAAMPYTRSCGLVLAAGCGFRAERDCKLRPDVWGPSGLGAN